MNEGVHEEVRDGAKLGPLVGCVGTAVGYALGSRVGFREGHSEGQRVGINVGIDEVGNFVGLLDDVGDCDGPFVGDLNVCAKEENCDMLNSVCRSIK